MGIHPLLVSYQNLAVQKIEYRADLTAIKQFPRFKHPMMSTFKKFDEQTSQMDFTNVPISMLCMCIVPLLFGGFVDSHPTADERIAHIEKHIT